ncbi:MAG TPA: GHMP kinase [Bacteroidetes bacterium]|nr:GHMP kinase [Bacteroidota bacterium]
MHSLSFHAHGKLLLFGEYAVLDGCRALAWPTKFGQSLQVNSEPTHVKGLYWKSFDHKGGLWFEAWFDEDLNLLHGLDDEIARRLQRFLLQARALNPLFLMDGLYHEAHISADYPREWGLGSSSTLISLIAQWAGVDAMELFFRSFRGSGYDIACTTARKPILYRLEAPQKAKWEELNWGKDVLHGAIFVYLGKKQDSREGIAFYQAQGSDKQALVQSMDELIGSLLQHPDRNSLLLAMKESEEILSKALNLEKVKDLNFPDFPGEVKSLGAWGGDFVMALAEEPQFETQNYFLKKGFEVVFSAEDLLI